MFVFLLCQSFSLQVKKKLRAPEGEVYGPVPRGSQHWARTSWGIFWSWVALCRTPVWAPPKKVAALLLVPAEFIGSPTRGENIAWLLLRLLHQPGENKPVCSSYFLCSLSLLPLSLHLVYQGFNEHCAQWDTARQLATWAGWRAM